MPERGAVKFDIRRGATVAEFGNFLADLENAYVALYFLPTIGRAGRLRRRFLIDYIDVDFFGPPYWANPRAVELVYPEDQLEISRISIQSPGWLELSGLAGILEQMREWLKDRHERKKDMDWRGQAEKDRAQAELEILRAQAERERAGAIGDYYRLLEEMGYSPEERQRMLWDRLGGPMMRLGQHQDSGLLGSQGDDTDDKAE